MATEQLIEAARKALERAQTDREAAQAEAARAKAIADEAARRATKAEGEAEYQLTGKDPTDPSRPPNPKKGPGPIYKKAKSDAEAARAEARAAEQTANVAKSKAASALERAEAAEKRMGDFNAQIEERKAADAYRTRTLIAIGSGIAVTTGISAAQKLLEGRSARSATSLLLSDLAKGKGGAEGVKATLRAMERAGTGAPLSWRGLAGKATVPLGASGALLLTSTYIKGEAEKFRANGQEQIAQALDTFALAERYAAVGLIAEGTVGTVYDAFKKVGKPTASVKQLQVFERAKAAVGIAEPLTKPVVNKVAKAATKSVATPGSNVALKEAARLVGATVSGRQTNARLAKAIAETAARVAEPAVKATATTTATTQAAGATLATLRKGFRSVAGKAALPLAVGLSAVAGLSAAAEAKGRGQSSTKAAAKGLVKFADDALLGAPGAIARQARTPLAIARRSRMKRVLAQPGGYAAAAARASQRRFKDERKTAKVVKSDGIRDAYVTKDGVFVPAKVMTAKMRKPRR